MKSKKLFLTLIAVLMVCVLAFAFAACDKNNNGGNQVDPNNNNNNNQTGNTDNNTVTVSDKLNSAVSAVSTTVDSLANGIKDGKFDAALSASVALTVGDDIDVAYTLGTQASIDLLNDNGTDKAIVYLNDKNGQLCQLYFEEVADADGLVYVTVGDFKRAINVGNVTDILQLYGFTQEFFAYSDFVTMTGFDLTSLWTDFAPTVASMLPETLDQDGYIALDSSLTGIAAKMLPGLISGMGVDLDGIPGMLGIEGVDNFADMMKLVNLGLRTNVETAANGYLSDLVLEISLSQANTTKIPEGTIPTITFALSVHMDLSAQTVDAKITKADYTEIHAINGVLEGEIKLINKNGSADVYTYSLKADLDPMAVIAAERANFENFQLSDAVLSKLGVLEGVVKDSTGKVIAETFYNSKKDKNLAFAFIDWDYKGTEGGNFAHYCTFDIQKLVAFNSLATNSTRDVYTYSFGGGESAGFDMSAISGYIDTAKAIFEAAKANLSVFDGIDVIDEENSAIVISWDTYDAVLEFADKTAGDMIYMIYALLTYDPDDYEIEYPEGDYDGEIDLDEGNDEEIGEEVGEGNDEEIGEGNDEEIGEGNDDEVGEGNDDDDTPTFERPSLAELLDFVPPFIKKLFGDDLAAISISLDFAKSGYGVLDINSEEYTALFDQTNQAEITDKYIANVTPVVDTVRVPFGGQLPTQLEVNVTDLAGNTARKTAEISAITSFNNMILGEQTVCFFAKFDDQITALIPFSVKVSVYASEIGEIEINENRTAVDAEGTVYTAVVGENVQNFMFSIVIDGATYYLDKAEIACDGVDASGCFAAAGNYELTASIAGKSLTITIVVAEFSLGDVKYDDDEYAYVVSKDSAIDVTVTVNGKKYYLMPASITLNGKEIEITNGMTGKEIAAAAELKGASVTVGARSYYVGVEGLNLTFKVSNDKLNKVIVGDNEAGYQGLWLTFTTEEGYTFEKYYGVIVK